MDCKTCEAGLQSLRNCSGTGRPARVELNGALYTRCPRAIYLESIEARAMLRLYLECRRTNTYPCPGTPWEQTAFAIDLFDFLDEVMATQRNRKAPVGAEKMKKADTP